ncbi:Uncharacterized conserved protein, DUF952 family [Cohaesibacter marisflavi]|uniref:Uncharacterized conserved protein, DUF952 family n=1 Tax=Cohaesibacter marisflavi TaxID=655353 RepID=A0A1I5D8U4_9HYPH|nr:DUF952 domain-containing protein [Cohaesibacter marisflavi]SFN95688.1 Uncharacterized conserved protein, DUF952 family [Cohaesibacter marisflavi]
MAKRIYKLVTKDQWNEAKAKGVFEGAPVDLADGFIHFSTKEQVEETARKHFKGIDDLLLLGVSVEKLERCAGPVTWEPSRGGALFPHLYHSMPLEAVSEESVLPMTPDGHHRFPQLQEE